MIEEPKQTTPQEELAGDTGPMPPKCQNEIWNASPADGHGLMAEEPLARSSRTAYTPIAGRTQLTWQFLFAGTLSTQ